jgi:tetratricopeptide (TPR) repeat protein
VLLIWVMPARGFAARRKTLSAALYAAALCVAAPALAQGTAASDDLARRHFDSGVAYLEESDLENAMKAFQKAYDLSRRPTILLNIATVQERRGDLAAAIAALDGYLSAEPHGEHAATTRLRIQNLQKRLDAAEAQSNEPPASDVPSPSPTNTAPQAAAPPAAPGVVPAAPPPPAPAPTSRDDGAPIAVYALLGLGGAATLTAIVTGVLANGEYARAERDCSPHCTRSDVSTGKTLALVSTIATGAAIVGGGLGLTLLFTSSTSTAAAPRTELRVGMGGEGPRASVRYRF